MGNKTILLHWGLYHRNQLFFCSTSVPTPTPQPFASPSPLHTPRPPHPSMRPDLQPPVPGGFAGQGSFEPHQEPHLPVPQGFSQHHEGPPPHQEPPPPFPTHELSGSPVHQFGPPSGQGAQFLGTGSDPHRPQGNPDLIPDRPAHQRQPSSGKYPNPLSIFFVVFLCFLWLAAQWLQVLFDNACIYLRQKRCPN